MMPMKGAPVLLASSVVLACQGSSAPSEAWTTQDSVGIEIVESSGAVWTGGEAWSLHPSPDVFLGDEQDAATRFHTVTGAVLTNGGALVVANSGTGELRFFDASGGFVRAVGGIGDGPGEFRWIESVEAYRGDSIFAYDDRLGRGSIFDSEGRLGRTLSFLLPEEGIARDVLPVADGRLVVQRSGPTAARTENAQGLIMNPAIFSLWSPEGILERSLFEARGDELFIMPPREGTSYVRYQIPLFASRTVASVRGTDLVTRSGGGFGLAVVSFEGRVRQILRRPGPERVLTRSEVDSTFAAMVGVQYDGRPLYALPYPETEPSFGKILADPDGNLWVSEYAQRGEAPLMWSVFHPDGMYLGDVRAPADTEILDIGSTMVVGRVEDALGLEHIAVWRLLKPQ